MDALWLFLLRLGLAAVFLVAGLAKLAAQRDMAALFDALGAPWLMWAVGIWEVGGAIGLLVPRWTGIAAAALALLMVAVMAVHLFVLSVGSLAPALIVFALALVVASARIGQLTRPGDRPPRLPRAL